MRKRAARTSISFANNKWREKYGSAFAFAKKGTTIQKGTLQKLPMSARMAKKICSMRSRHEVAVAVSPEAVSVTAASAAQSARYLSSAKYISQNLTNGLTNPLLNKLSMMMRVSSEQVCRSQASWAEKTLTTHAAMASPMVLGVVQA